MTVNFSRQQETIAAVATAIGPGGIGVVRVSGPDSVAIARKIFRTPRGKTVTDFRSHRVYYGHAVNDSGEIVDEVLLTLMAAPKSYTREDVVEVSCHGGFAAVRSVLDLVTAAGARLAEPGEFTKRAFLNGRLDLVQAEAVLDVINAQTESFLKVSANQLKGQLTAALEGLRQGFLEACARLEALINFPDEGIEEQDREQLSRLLGEMAQTLEDLLRRGEEGRLLREGVKIVLCGRPNVGKSSLLNALLKQPRAIVSEVAGTTRDTIEEPAQINGIAVQLVDTAGILEPRDALEEQAVARSRLSVQSADVVLLVLAGDEKLGPRDLEIIEFVKGQNLLVVVSKADLVCRLSDEEIHAVLPGKRIVRVSVVGPSQNAVSADSPPVGLDAGSGAVANALLDQLREAISQTVLGGRAPAVGNVLLTNRRHIESLKDALAELTDARNALAENLSLEFVAESLKNAVACLDRVTGRELDADLVDEIFARFCIGK